MQYMEETTMTYDVKNLLDRVKKMEWYEVTTDLPEEFRFGGPVPYDLFIEDGKITAKILAYSTQDATDKLLEYLDGQSGGLP